MFENVKISCLLNENSCNKSKICTEIKRWKTMEIDLDKQRTGETAITDHSDKYKTALALVQ